MSRQEGVAEGEGFDPDPDMRPCEHRRQWMRGRLCLGCDNTGWRRRVADEEGVDPYSVGIQGSVTREVPVVLEGHRLDAVIEQLERLEGVRAGTELVEDRLTRQLRLFGRRDKTATNILTTLERVRSVLPEFRACSEEGLKLLALLVPGRISTPPEPA